MSIVKTGFIAFGLLGTILVTALLITSGNSMPSYITIGQTDETKKGKDYEAASKIGNDYTWLLVEPFQKENEHWWQWSYNNLKNEGKSETEKFKLETVTDAFLPKSDENKDKSLNNVCFNLYQLETANTIGDDEKEADKYKLGTDLWKYCSPLGARPVTIEANKDTYADKTVGKIKNGLPSVADGVNSLFWKLKTQWFYGLKSVPEGKKIFKEAFDKNKDKEDKPSLREVCKQAYESEENNAADTETYCIAKFSKA